MLDLDIDAACASDAELTVLNAYALAEQLAAVARPRMSIPVEEESADAESEVPRTAIWVPRIQEVEGVSGDQLAPIHGRLIAFGLLNFQLQGREEGVVYRLTPDGRKALSVGASAVFEEEPARRSA